jgi:hypothetical protein
LPRLKRATPRQRDKQAIVTGRGSSKPVLRENQS